MDDLEGQDFVRAFSQAFGATANTDMRLKAERRAGMSSKQRARRAKKAATLNFRCSDQVRSQVEQLATKLDTNFTGVLEVAVVRLARSEGVA